MRRCLDEFFLQGDKARAKPGEAEVPGFSLKKGGFLGCFWAAGCLFF